ncbi:MAG: endonuclease MutS2, partial [Cyclobacteriaceae bacterium]|nr:endonuclease MutS2 [Cyclobacteriaceae bacterium]
MRTFPANIEEKLEMDQVREDLSRLCQTDAAREKVAGALPLNRFAELSHLLDALRECIHILTRADEKPSRQFEDITPFVKKVKVAGSFLLAEDLVILKTGLSAIYTWTRFLKKYKDDYPVLSRQVFGFISDMELVREIERVVDEKGEIRSNASRELMLIRGEIIRAEQKVRKSIRSILEKARKDKFTDDDSEVTIREGRLVIPIRAEFKRRIPGFVHDESSTGQTVYMEPTEVLELNNQVREWQYQERREIQRILLELADKIRLALSDLEQGSLFLIDMDFLVAKAQYAELYHAVVPQLQKTPGVDLKNACHPLLKKLNTALGKPVVPLSLSLDHQHYRMLIISGPNAGGKSVAMKTVGLLQYMLQCGFPVTVDETSQFGVFDQFFLDIGDSQSLENDLSTYSSRLRAMKFFSDFADSRTLVLIDEFGTGTEPQYGGAIAEAILNRISHLKSYGIITTHYANIKKFAENKKTMVNGAMRYDTDRLEPLYELEVGKPGSSFAFEIARKTGLHPSLIEYAKGKIGDSQVDFDKLLAQLENDKRKYETLTGRLENREKELKSLRNDYESMKLMLETERKSILKEAKTEAKKLLADTNRRIEQTIREIKEQQADKDKTRKLRDDLAQFNQSLTEKEEKKKVQRKKEESSPLQVGDFVAIDGQDGFGEVVSIKNKQAEISFGALKSYVNVDRLRKVSNREMKKEVRTRVGGIDMPRRQAQFSPDLDIRGKRAEEALSLISQFIDQAVLLGAPQVRVLHGKGYGILRDVIRTHLKEEPQVVAFADEHIERGGNG